MWQFLVKNWLRGYATDQIYKAATETAQQHAEAKTSGEPGDDAPASPAVGSVDVGIVMSHISEAGRIIDRLSETTTLRGDGFAAHFGVIAGKHIVVIVAANENHADSESSAASAAAAVIAGHQPKWMIAAGFATATAPQISVGNIVLADSVGDRSGKRLHLRLNVDRRSLEAIRGTHVGAITSAPHVSDEREPAAANDESILCRDVASFVVAETCRQSKIPCMVVRAITESADEHAAAEVQNIHNQSSIAGKLGAATGAVWRRPGSVKDMWHDKEVALDGSERLARFLCGMIAQLPAATEEPTA